MNTPFPPRFGGLTVRDVLPESSRAGGDDLYFQSCSGDWKTCQPGDLFVAIDSETGDGHEHAQQAIDLGAVGVVTERLLAIDAPQFLVDDSRQAFGRLCHALTGYPTGRLQSIVVSGSDGRTIVSHLVESVLKASGLGVGLASSLNRGLEDLNEPDEDPNRAASQHQRTCAGRLAEWMAEQVLRGRQAAVLEICSETLARHALAGATFDAAVITNIRSDSSGLHGSELNYWRLQQRVLRHLKPEGIAVLNADDPHSARLLPRLKTPALTFGIQQPADVSAILLESDSSGQTFSLTAGNDTAVVRSRTIGTHFVYNCLAAAAVGLSQNIGLALIGRGLELASALPGRLERIECGQEFGVWVDSAWRPAQIASAVHAVRQVTRGRLLVAVTMHPRQSPQQRKRIGELMQRHCQHLVITQPDCSMIRDYEPAHQILDGVGNHDQVRLMPNRMDAIEWLLAEARPGDAVLLTGVGEKPIASIGDQNWTVSDRELVQAWLYDQQERLTPAARQRAQIYRMEDFRQ